MSTLAHRPLMILITFLGVSACSAGPRTDAGLVGAPEDADTSEEAVSGSLPAGSTLQATANVNLRSGASSSKAILDVVPKGAHVTLIASAPSNGFYQVDYEGTTGWSYGKYYVLASSSSTSGSSGSGTSSSGGGTGVCTGEGLSSWSCSGSYGKIKMADCEYYATAFGCWKDSNGNNHSDSGDNCIPACLSQAQQSICSGMSGPSCERSVNWYAAGKGRWPCMTRLRVSNPKNGRSAVVVVLDAGPACWVEAKVSHAVADISYPAAHYLFDGNEPGVSEKELMVVEEVAGSTPLGPE